MRQLLVLSMLTAIFGVLMVAGVAIADPGLSTNVPAHRHFVKQASGAMVEVGPRFSVNSELRRYSPRYPGEDLDGIGQYIYPGRFSTPQKD